MLSLINRNTFKKKTPASSIGFAAPFNPLDLPNYQNAYLMNLTTDTPPGSILAAGSQWQDIKLLSAVSKFLQCAAATVTQNINGFNCVVLNVTNTRYNNIPFDIFNNTFTNFTILIGFKKNAAVIDYDMIFAQNNSVEDERCYIAITPGLKLELQLANSLGANAITCLSANNYNDQLPHAIIGTFDQTNKTCRLITHTGENITNTNAAYVSKNLQGNSSGDCRLGDWNFAPPLSGQPAAYGDFILLNTVANNGLINSLMAWECSRLGIAHVPI